MTDWTTIELHQTDYSEFLTPDDSEFLYRVVGCSNMSAIRLESYRIVRETGASYFIDHWSCLPGKQKRILKGEGKRFAHKKKTWALCSFIKRNARRQILLENALSFNALSGDKAKDVLQSRMAVSNSNLTIPTSNP